MQPMAVVDSDSAPPLSSSSPRRSRTRRYVVLVLVSVLAVVVVCVIDFRLLSDRTIHAFRPSALIPTPADVAITVADVAAEDTPPQPLPLPAVRSILHDRTVAMRPLEGKSRTIAHELPLQATNTNTSTKVLVSTDTFAQHGTNRSGVHLRLKNVAVLNDLPTREQDALLVLVVLNDHHSYGPNRSIGDLCTLLATSVTHPKHQTSVAILTSSEDEFRHIQQRMEMEMEMEIPQYAQLSLILRNDFAANGLTRDNRHDDAIQNMRRRMIARYRNYLLLATLEPWHQHVLWLDADVHIVPPGLITKMIRSQRDIIEPICYSGSPPSTFEYDRNAWVGERKRPRNDQERKGFVPGNTLAKHMSELPAPQPDFVPLDSVGGTMLYVRADIHRQGVVFPHFYVIGSEWASEGYDGVETEGLCYVAHLLGYKCWGMPNDPIYHVHSSSRAEKQSAHNPFEFEFVSTTASRATISLPISTNGVVWQWLGGSWVARAMSQFAHGISALDFASSATLEAPVWLLGKQFHGDGDLDKYKTAFESILWYTYRRDFAKMEPYDYTSDAGWGCMLRSAQMMLSQALQRQLLGREWTLPPFSTEPLPDQYVALLQWFVDSPQHACRYSIHNMVKLGLQYDKLPGEWYGPTTAALVMRDLVNLHSREYGGALAMYVPQEGVVYSDDVQKLVVSHLDSDAGATNERIHQRHQEQHPPDFFDPLLNPPQRDVEKQWTRALLVLIPLRLGLDSLNESYVPALDKTFTFPQSVGIIGGKKGHSVYFVGAQRERLHLLDPHDVHATTEIDASFPTATHLRTVHAPKPLVMNVQSIDPSMALGFLCDSRSDYEDFCRRVRDLQREFGSMCPFSVADRRPDYAASEMEMMMTDCLLSSPGDSMHEDAMSGGGGAMSATGHESDDDEYVLI